VFSLCLPYSLCLFVCVSVLEKKNIFPSYERSEGEGNDPFKTNPEGTCFQRTPCSIKQTLAWVPRGCPPNTGVTVCCIPFLVVSFRGQMKLEPRPHKFPLGIEFNFFDEHLRHFFYERPPRTVHSSRCRGLALSHGLTLHIGLTSLRLSP